MSQATIRWGTLSSHYRLSMIDPSVVCNGHRCTLGSVGHLRQHGFASAPQPQRVVARRAAVTTHASVQARPASIELKTFDGNSSGSQELALQVAGKDSAKGLVHRYLVTVRQNARAVCVCFVHAAITMHAQKLFYAEHGSYTVAREDMFVIVHIKAIHTITSLPDI